MRVYIDQNGLFYLYRDDGRVAYADTKSQQLCYLRDGDIPAPREDNAKQVGLMPVRMVSLLRSIPSKTLSSQIRAFSKGPDDF